jgi:hypothetical protein
MGGKKISEKLVDKPRASPRVGCRDLLDCIFGLSTPTACDIQQNPSKEHHKRRRIKARNGSSGLVEGSIHNVPPLGPSVLLFLTVLPNRINGMKHDVPTNGMILRHEIVRHGEETQKE